MARETTMRATCPNCGSERCVGFYAVHGVPTNSCLLVSDRQQALDFQTGDIALSFCQTCGFIFNALWQPDRTVYSEQYEETQGFSPTFNTFHRRLAEELVERHQLHEKDVLEIGCGKGEFLSLICELGRNRGVGYDPSFVPARLDGHAQQIRFVRDFFTESTAESPPDFVCCKMTLEHIGETRRFVDAVRRLASAERGTVVFFQIPDVRRILSETAFWDIYYEHCSYFSPASLAYLFRHAGFEVLRTSTGYDDQYLMIEARAATDGLDVASIAAERQEMETLAGQAADFTAAVDRIAGEWRAQLHQRIVRSRRTVLWGSGSKAVAFLTTLGIRDEIEYVVDINPFRQGRFVPGTGQRIVPPSFLAQYRPDLVIVMNPIYCGEIGAELRRQGVSAELVSVGSNRRLTESFAEPASTRVAV
ncbi:MAG TPA: class I SAM-dependent methyltransferase [Xanthobacteraceae bacterium]|nr:class I SAM-dependent methyltransferase [Xanthobacteraceae bacterium]